MLYINKVATLLISIYILGTLIKDIYTYQYKYLHGVYRFKILKYLLHRYLNRFCVIFNILHN